MIANHKLVIIILGMTLSCVPADACGGQESSGLLEKKVHYAEEIAAKPTIFRESNLPHLPLSLKQVEFLIDHPRVSMALAHQYAPFLDNYRVEVRPDQMIHISDPGKLSGEAERIDARPGRRVYLIAGHFDIFKIRFNGHMVLMAVYSERFESAAVATEVTTSASIKINNVFAGAIARLVNYLFPKKVDERIDRFIRAAESIAVGVHKDPAGSFRKLSNSGEVSAEELRKFVRLFSDGKGI